MLTHHFSAASSDEWATSVSFHHEFPAAAAICELSLTSTSESDDQAGTNLGFLDYTFVDSDGQLKAVGVPFGSRLPVVGHDQMVSVEWYMRIYRVASVGLLNVFFWDSVH
jgi:hypothetical protein